MKNSHALAGAITGLIAMTAAGGSLAAAEKMEKCYGVVKAGKNDCQTSVSACAGSATKDGQKDAWLYLPKGTCDKLVSGSLSAAKSDKKK
jgi:uncharacterized membrane protein